MTTAYEVFLSSEQEDGFVVLEANSIMEAVDRTIAHAKKNHPGLFDSFGNLKETGFFPLVYEIKHWQ